jgi:putative ABC transport system ATP-binding protein
VAIGRAYAHRPRLIFADEPTGNLDPSTSKQVLESLLAINDNHETTMLLVTHDLELAKLMERHIAVRDGQCVEVTE